MIKGKKRVSPEVYDQNYYLSECGGFKEYKKSKGRKYERRLNRILTEMPDVKNKIVLDVGCGRGEQVIWAACNGAKSVWGIDYSKDAILLAKQALKTYPKNIQNLVNLIVMDAKNINFPNKIFDVVLFTEVFEHLYAHEQEEVFKEIKRVLKDDGYFFFHTEPNKYFNDYFYKYWCYPISSFLIMLNRLIFKNNFPNIPRPHMVRTESQKVTHVNEATYFRIKDIVKRNGFIGKNITTNIIWIKPRLSWKDDLYNFIVFLYPLSCFFPLNIIFGQDFLHVLRKK